MNSHDTYHAHIKVSDTHHTTTVLYCTKPPSVEPVETTTAHGMLQTIIPNRMLL